MFSKTERLLYSIVGSTSTNALPFACAVDMVCDLLFTEKLSRGNIRVTKDVYPVVAERLGKSTAAVTRRISYFGNLCWDMAVKENRVVELYGRPLCEAPSTADLLVYFAVLLHYGTPFFTVMETPDLEVEG